MRDFLTPAIDAINACERPLIAGHQVPDADCIASMLALAEAARAAGKSPRIVLDDADVSQRLAFMLDLAPQAPRVGDIDADADLLIVVDTAHARRLNAPTKIADLPEPPPVLNIDHHDTNEQFGSINCVVPGAASTAELIAELLDETGWAITPEIATLLYAGIFEDTLGFSLPGVSERVMRTAAALVAAGADVPTLGDRLVRSQSLSEFKLMQTVYDNTTLSADGRLAYSTVSYDELTASGCTPADIDNQVAVPRSLEGVELAILFSEGEPGNVRINFRGKGGVEVVSLAREFDGGGHTQSAGARVAGSLEEVRKRVLSAAAKHLDIVS